MLDLLSFTRILASNLAPALLIACVASPPQETPYQPSVANLFEVQSGGGYHDRRVDEDPSLIHVEFQGNQSTPRNTVVRYWLRRAGEVCPTGYEILDVRTTTLQQETGSGSLRLVGRRAVGTVRCSSPGSRSAT